MNWVLQPSKTSNRWWAGDLGEIRFWLECNWHSKRRVEIVLSAYDPNAYPWRPPHTHLREIRLRTEAEDRLAELMTEAAVGPYAVLETL